jgi:hypothetical protein
MKLSGCKNLRKAARVFRFKQTGYFSLVSSIPASSLRDPRGRHFEQRARVGVVADHNYIA